jgi:DNA-repair protein XRCC2
MALPTSTTPDTSLRRGDIIEIQGPSGSGKTQLLYFIVMTTLLPFDLPLEYRRRISSASTKPPQAAFKADNLLIGGRGKSVVLCDCDGRWSLSRLHSMIVGYLQGRLRQAPFSISNTSTYELRPSLERVAEGMLRHLHVFRPASTIALATTLLCLPSYHTRRMGDEDISMLIIDPINPLYWHDRWVVEAADASQPRLAARPPLQAVVSALQKLISVYRPIIFLTNHALMPLTQTSAFYKQHLPPTYPAPFEANTHTRPKASLLSLTHHITLSLPRIAPYSASMTFEAACSDIERREMAEKGGVVGILRTPPGEFPETKVGRFHFGIEARGLWT